MMISTIFILLLITTLYNILNVVQSAGLPQQSLLAEGNSSGTPTFHLSNAVKENSKCEQLGDLMKKVESSVQSLHEKSHNWAILHHHIASWNDGIRVLENKLDILKRTQEEQQQLLNKFEFILTQQFGGSDKLAKISLDNAGTSRLSKGDIDNIKQLLISERKTLKSDMNSKLNNILQELQAQQPNERRNKSNNMKLTENTCGSATPSAIHKIEHRLSNISEKMAQQKDLKQIHSLEKRNSKSLESLLSRLQRVGDFCHVISGELTTFTESSDIILKRIEKLVRNINDKHSAWEEEEHKRQSRCGVQDKYDVDGDEEVDAAEEPEEEHDEDEKESEELETTEIQTKPTEENIQSKASTENETLEKDEDEFEIDANISEIELLRPDLSGCHELFNDLSPDDSTERIDGIYKFLQPEINAAERDFNERYCVFAANDLTSSQLPWTVIQQRGPYVEQENFNRSWSEYRNGFGHLTRDFWFGLEFIHRLVYPDNYELRIELEDFNNTRVWAEYSIFRIDSEEYNYNLVIGGYRGTVDDAMKYHNEMDFSTYDRRNDKSIDACCSCAMGYGSGWWFDNCSEANLNGVYRSSPYGHNYIGIMWELWHDHADYSLKRTRMMIRPHGVAGSTNQQDDP